MRVIIDKDRAAFTRLRTRAGALAISPGDMAGPVLSIFGQIHRVQERRIFASEATAAGRAWPALNPRYAARKAKAFGRKKILQLTGETKARFTVAQHPGYYQDFVPRGTSGAGTFRFGAYSTVGAAHRYGIPLLARRTSRESRRIFGGIAARLPVRDMITKTQAMIAEFNRALLTWYSARIKQVLRARTR